MCAIPPVSDSRQPSHCENGHGIDKPPVVVLLGHSLLLDAVATGLADSQLPGLVLLDTNGPDMEARLKSLKPRLILFDLRCTFTECLFHVLLELPSAALLGLDQDASHALLLSGKRCVTPTMDQMCQLVHEEVGSGITGTSTTMATRSTPTPASAASSSETIT
jgi:hypothetical protein